MKIRFTQLPMRNKGFISIYFIFVLLIISICCMDITANVNSYLQYLQTRELFEQMNYLEVLSIKKVKDDFRNYCEKDQSIHYKGCRLDYSYSSNEAHVVIECQGNVRERTIVFDDQSELIEDYY